MTTRELDAWHWGHDLLGDAALRASELATRGVAASFVRRSRTLLGEEPAAPDTH